MFINSLRLLYNIFWSYLPPPQHLSYPPPSPLATHLCVPLISKHIRSNLCWLYSWMCGLSLAHNRLTRVPLLRNTDSDSPSSYQLPMPPQLGVGHCVHLPSPWRNLVWLEYEQVLCTLSQSLWLYIHNFHSIQKILFPCTYPPPLALTLFLPPPPEINPEPWKRCVWYKCSSKGHVVHKLFIFEPWSVVALGVIAICCEKKKVSLVRTERLVDLRVEGQAIQRPFNSMSIEHHKSNRFSPRIYDQSSQKFMVW